jgi:alkaline phosphatase D
LTILIFFETMVLPTNHRRADRIAFGSCNRQDRQNNFWPIIEARRPVAFIWGGDAIYAGK